jgi:hypothetical protein
MKENSNWARAGENGDRRSDTAALRDFTIVKKERKKSGRKSSETDRKKDYKLPRDIRCIGSKRGEKRDTRS